MAADEAGTFAELSALRRELIDRKIAEHGGCTVKLMGDGAWSSPPAWYTLLECAVLFRWLWASATPRNRKTGGSSFGSVSTLATLSLRGRYLRRWCQCSSEGLSPWPSRAAFASPLSARARLTKRQSVFGPWRADRKEHSTSDLRSLRFVGGHVIGNSAGGQRFRSHRKHNDLQSPCCHLQT